MTLRACIVALVIDPVSGDCLAAPGFHASHDASFASSPSGFQSHIAGDE